MSETTVTTDHDAIVAKAFLEEHGAEFVGYLQRVNRLLSDTGQPLLGLDGQLPSYQLVSQIDTDRESMPNGITRSDHAEILRAIACVKGKLAYDEVESLFGKKPGSEFVGYLRWVNRYLAASGQEPLGLDGQLPSYAVVHELKLGVPREALCGVEGRTLDRNELRTAFVQLERILAAREGIKPKPDERHDLRSASPMSSRHRRLSDSATPLAA